ncbi:MULTISPECIES: hypothetical protein [Bacillus amyloliquefaciens group]|uniref:hypothetical protein n=1 Tax=Bacillus amyloliquefaciens group TaxID=1938374 RepID=UPI00068CDCDA|nr:MULTISPECIES: hypothetical protein [Bacillus amyloliquefaciens group]KYC88753.1 hypothetical protein B4140_3595 [Bacillus amyloliquefaciens]MEB3985688.1 hypothetical protein [Bacillus velezensis]POR15523.1 hypothetical protein B9W23_06345 [Bacillus velezensis]QCE20267.1 hypothetical protein SB21_18830 [Bacillus velezensis]QQY05369.1 hypothetical protein JKJ03_18510 [Bacillus velezensis]
MNQSVISYYREKAVEELFKINSFQKSWETYKSTINNLIGSSLTANKVIDLGNNLSYIFESTTVKGRGQGTLSSSGVIWEALVCWYLNLGLIGSRTVVVKQKKSLIPKPIKNAITVKYGTVPSNTESDLIAITFPDKPDYSINKDNIKIESNGKNIPVLYRGKFKLIQTLDHLVDRDFGEIKVDIIQCKTNWNDNAQIPMLWDMVYSSTGFKHLITIGNEGYSIRDLRGFSYSFVTVPSNKNGKFTATSTAVQRVSKLTGGNYWGTKSESGVAHSINEIFDKNFATCSSKSIRGRLTSELKSFKERYYYFKL